MNVFCQHLDILSFLGFVRHNGSSAILVLKSSGECMNALLLCDFFDAIISPIKNQNLLLDETEKQK